jgi:hypothetical protein
MTKDELHTFLDAYPDFAEAANWTEAARTTVGTARSRSATSSLGLAGGSTAVTRHDDDGLGAFDLWRVVAARLAARFPRESQLAPTAVPTRWAL